MTGISLIEIRIMKLLSNESGDYLPKTRIGANVYTLTKI